MQSIEDNTVHVRSRNARQDEDREALGHRVETWSQRGPRAPRRIRRGERGIEIGDWKATNNWKATKKAMHIKNDNKLRWEKKSTWQREKKNINVVLCSFSALQSCCQKWDRVVASSILCLHLFLFPSSTSTISLAFSLLPLFLSFILLLYTPCSTLWSCPSCHISSPFLFRFSSYLYFHPPFFFCLLPCSSSCSSLPLSNPVFNSLTLPPALFPSFPSLCQSSLHLSLLFLPTL